MFSYIFVECEKSPPTQIGKDLFQSNHKTSQMVGIIYCVFKALFKFNSVYS
jgi:hypothetical protein